MKITEGILPAGWIGLTLEDAAEIHDNLREPVNSSERAKRPGTYPYYGATGQVGWIDDFRQDGEYVLLGEDGAPFFEPTKEKAYLVSGKCWVNNHAHVLKGREGLCSNRYLLYSLNQTNYRGYANGTTRLKLTQSAMRQLPINLAPLAEQHRIVAKIEELFSELDKGIENLKTARAQLKVYRQALLKHAFEGKLSAQWRAENQDKLETAAVLQQRIQQERAQRYQQQLADWEASVKVWGANGSVDKKPAKPRKTVELDKPSTEHSSRIWDVPNGWQWIQIGEFAFVTKLAGFEYTKYVRYSDDGDLPVIKAENAGPNGFRVTQYSHVYSDSVAELTRSHLWGGELLMVFVGAGTGNVATVPSDKRFFLGPNVGMMRVESDEVNPRYVEHFLRSPLGKDLALASVKAVAQPSLSMGTIRQIPVALPTRAEQDEIVDQIEAKLSEVDQLEQTITTSLQQAEALRQSILKKAFAGLLVPQDPHDEPASVLLARIKAERATAEESSAVRQRGKRG